MNLEFVKMHSLGNDFMIIDAVSRKVSLSPDIIIKLADRHEGIGFDQCILVEQGTQEGIDFFYRIFNANGQEVGQCGNGARCLAHFIHYKKLSNKKTLKVMTLTTQMNLSINEDNTVTVEMEKPKLRPPEIPFIGSSQQDVTYSLPLNEHHSIDKMYLINVGNPHAILLVNDLEAVLVSELGKQISEHHFFPEQINVGFMHVINSDTIELRVYERGCGETRACGSGAVAAAAIGRLYNNLAPEIVVKLPGGKLTVKWPDTTGPIYLKGPSTLVYEAVLNSELI